MKEPSKPSSLLPRHNIGFLVVSFSLLLLNSGQAFPANEELPFYEATALREALVAEDTASLAPTACPKRLQQSHSILRDARHSALGGADSFVTHLEKEAAMLAEKLMQWACAARLGGEEGRMAARYLSRFHSAVAQLRVIVQAIADTRNPPAVAPERFTDRFQFTETQWRDQTPGHSISTAHPELTEKDGDARNPATKALPSLPVPSSPPFPSIPKVLPLSVPHRGRPPFLPQRAEEKSWARTLAASPEAQREALCNISMHWNISDWQARCAQGTAITNAWEGIGYSNTQETVTALMLTERRLSGPIPEALSALTALENLVLSNNQLSGTVPGQLSALTALEDLSLSNNRLNGTIPRQLSSLTAMMNLALYSNELSGTIPRQLSALTALRNLALYYNRLTGTIPEQLSALTALTYLALSNNQLGGTIPGELDALTALTTLILSNNQLSGTAPGQLSALTALEDLSLSNNRLNGTIPEQLSALTALTYFALSNNQLGGTIPGELGALTALTILSLSTNQLRGSIPGQLSSLAALTALDLHTNQLSGSIPGQLSSLTALRHVALYFNQLSGTIPTGLSVLTALTYLSLSDNKLSGTIPRELGDLIALTRLTLSTNQLTGTIPRELGCLTALTAMYLHTNSLSGTIPEELSALTALRHLHAYINHLSGTIPWQLSSLTALTFLDLGVNQLSGTIPVELSSLTAVGNLGLSTNRLSGTIPEQLSALTALMTLHLHTNGLHGTIPGQLSTLTALTALLLHGNELSGILPLSFTSLTALRRLELQTTRVHGVALGMEQWLTRLTTFHVTGSPLTQLSCGGFPDAVYDAALRLCVASDFLPSTEGACGDIGFLNASRVCLACGLEVATVPPTHTVSNAFLQIAVALSCRYSREYELLSSVHIHSLDPSQSEEFYGEVKDTHWMDRWRLALHDNQAFLGNVELLLPLWGELAWDVVGQRQEPIIGNVASLALEMGASKDDIPPWHANVSFPPSVVAALDAYVGTRPLNGSTVSLSPCPDGQALLEALEDACPFPGPCSTISLQRATTSSDCEYASTLDPQEHTSRQQVEVTSVSFRMHSVPPSLLSGSDSLGGSEGVAALPLSAQPLRRALPVVHSIVPLSNGNKTSIPVLSRHVHCAPWTSMDPNNTAPMVLYGEVLLPNEQSVLSLTNSTTTVLDTSGTWPVGSSLLSLWPNGRVAQRGTQLGPSYSNIAPLATPALLSLAVLVNPDAEAVRLHLWFNGTFHTSIAFSAQGPGYLTNMHTCLANAHPEATVTSQWHSHGNAFYEHDAARLLGRRFMARPYAGGLAVRAAALARR